MIIIAGGTRSCASSGGTVVPLVARLEPRVSRLVVRLALGPVRREIKGADAAQVNSARVLFYVFFCHLPTSGENIP
jgi:hypothetical protein